MTDEKLTPVHPGEHLAEFLDDFGIGSERLAQDLQVPLIRIHAIINGQSAISADMALRLSRYFGTSATFWMALQAKYELALAEHEAGDAISRLPCVVA